MRSSRRRHRRQREKQFENLAAYLIVLYRSDPNRFLREWDKRVSSWIDEIHYRGRRLRMKTESKESYFRIFAVLEFVEQFLIQHPEINRKVGPTTRDVLHHESAKVLAAVADKRLYHLVAQYRRAQLLRI